MHYACSDATRARKKRRKLTTLPSAAAAGSASDSLHALADMPAILPRPWILRHCNVIIPEVAMSYFIIVFLGSYGRPLGQVKTILFISRLPVNIESSRYLSTS